LGVVRAALVGPSHRGVRHSSGRWAPEVSRNSRRVSSPRIDAQSTVGDIRSEITVSLENRACSLCCLVLRVPILHVWFCNLMDAGPHSLVLSKSFPGSPGGSPTGPAQPRVVVSRAARRGRMPPAEVPADPATSSRDANSPIMTLGALVLA